jgi:hypothetical protein
MPFMDVIFDDLIPVMPVEKETGIISSPVLQASICCGKPAKHMVYWAKAY